MLAVHGIYDENGIRLLEPVAAPLNTQVLVVFPDAAASVEECGGLMDLFGCLKNSTAFEGDPVAIQREMRDEWDD